MAGIRKIKLQNTIVFYFVFLISLFFIILLFLLLAIKPNVPEQLQGYYISMEHMKLTEEALSIPLSELNDEPDNCLITAESLHSLFSAWYTRILFFSILIAFVLSLLLSFLVSCLLNRRIVRPIKETADSMSRFGKATGTAGTTLPTEFSGIETAFRNAENEISRLSSDFEHMSSYISHEQKNALALLRATLQNEYAAAGVKALAQIDSMVRNLDDILTLSMNVTELQKVDLSLVCGMVTDEYRKLFRDISFDFDEDAVLFIAGDELLLCRAVSNLIDNAIKYGENKPVSVYVGIQKDCPYVSVTDSGTGIPEEQLEKIFESHHRIGSRKKDGYGIGLTLVRHVADLFHGFVWVESKEGEGSVFKMVFPPFTPD